MESLDGQEAHRGGFSFENVHRNSYISSQANVTVPKARKTGTTIAGVVFKDGVVLGADTRATSGNIVADKNCAKIHYMAPNIYCCGAGTAADTENVTDMVSSQLQLHRLSTGRKSRVITGLRMLTQHLFRYQGHIGAALVLGGVDFSGPHLYCVYPHGSSSILPFVTMGSGSLAAMSVFEDRYRPDMERAEAMELVKDAIRSGIFNDLGSGSSVDLCVITKDKTEYLRPYDVASERGQKDMEFTYQPGTTTVLSENRVTLDDVIVETV
eukprot:scpid93119/ scgid29137/ Proteasome subunit beta type-7; Macropain chain Z; Multicatalytic endopeptidase complex chain Z; Proteasome subunit Z